MKESDSGEVEVSLTCLELSISFKMNLGNSQPSALTL